MSSTWQWGGLERYNIRKMVVAKIQFRTQMMRQNKSKYGHLFRVFEDSQQATHIHFDATKTGNSPTHPFIHPTVHTHTRAHALPYPHRLLRSTPARAQSTSWRSKVSSSGSSTGGEGTPSARTDTGGEAAGARGAGPGMGWHREEMGEGLDHHSVQQKIGPKRSQNINFRNDEFTPLQIYNGEGGWRVLILPTPPHRRSWREDEGTRRHHVSIPPWSEFSAWALR